MFRKFTVAVCIGAMAVSASAIAGETAKAQLMSIKGAVAVSQNGKIAEAKPGMLGAGDRVVARDGEAKLAYADGCVVTVKANTMATIADKSPCAGAPGLITAGGSAAQMGDMTAFQLVMGALAIGGLAYGIGSLVENQNNKDDEVRRPVSP